jgi:hypothetical protein
VFAGPVARDNDRPAFRAYRSSLQTVTGNGFTKVQLSSESFDTHGAFDSTTNYRFTPQVAGYYQINGQVNTAVSATYLIACIYKNGSLHSTGNDATTALRSTVHDVVYLNGSSDYVELYVYTTNTSITSAGPQDIYFSGVLVAPAA